MSFGGIQALLFYLAFLLLFFPYFSAHLFCSSFIFPLTYHYIVGQQFEFINELKSSRNYEVEMEV